MNAICKTCGIDTGAEAINDTAITLCEPCWDAEAERLDAKRKARLDRRCCGAPGPVAVDAIVRSWFGISEEK
jgi:hypothetical protein